MPFRKSFNTNLRNMNSNLGQGNVAEPFVLKGDIEGKPMNGTRWSPHFHKLWKRNALNPDGGPIHFRPTGPGCADMKRTYGPRVECIEGFDEFGTLKVINRNTLLRKIIFTVYSLN